MVFGIGDCGDGMSPVHHHMTGTMPQSSQLTEHFGLFLQSSTLLLRDVLELDGPAALSPFAFPLMP